MCSNYSTVGQENFNLEINNEKHSKSELTLPYLHFISCIAQDFEAFLVIFQSTELLIHILFEKMTPFNQIDDQIYLKEISY